MHDDMQYDPIQSQGHEPLKVGNPSIFKSYLLCHLQWELATDHWFVNYGTISKFGRAVFVIFVVFLCHVTLNLAETSIVKSRPSVPHGANLFFKIRITGGRATLSIFAVVYCCYSYRHFPIIKSPYVNEDRMIHWLGLVLQRCCLGDMNDVQPVKNMPLTPKIPVWKKFRQKTDAEQANPSWMEKKLPLEHRPLCTYLCISNGWEFYCHNTPSPPNIWAMVIVWRITGEIIWPALCCCAS